VVRPAWQGQFTEQLAVSAWHFAYWQQLAGCCAFGGQCSCMMNALFAEEVGNIVECMVKTL
jgi:hypothetical protein